MKMREKGRTGIHVSPYCLGTGSESEEIVGSAAVIGPRTMGHPTPITPRVTAPAIGRRACGGVTR
ncbi:hypothetical protein [Streptomyces sp. NPDC090798]|uniref:hypothetical protein n=1 Tax=Streptomyces sp. NPDC090798 TaxID=3365968 RepID=UPI0038119865